MSLAEWLRALRLGRKQRENLKEHKRIASACLVLHITQATSKACWPDIVEET